MSLKLSFSVSKIQRVFYGAVLILAITVSCKKKEQIGLEINNDNKVGVVFTDTLTLSTEAVLYNDSIITSDQIYSLTGSFVDPLFGNFTAKSYIQLAQASENKDVSGFTSMDSVVLNLNFVYHYGDTTKSQTIKVYELTSDLYKDSIYKSTETKKIPTYNSTALDLDAAFEARPSKQSQKIKLQDAFGSKILNDVIGSGKSNTDFITAFKGIALFPKTDGAEGAVIALDLLNNGTRVTIYYKNSTGVRDSVMLLASSNNTHFHTLKSDRSVSSDMVISSLVSNGNTAATNGAIYGQAGIGIRTKVRVPGLSTFKSKVGNLAINRAELLIPYSDDDNIAPVQITSRPIPSLRLIKMNADGSLKKVLSGTYYDEVPVFIDNSVSSTDPYSIPFNSTLNAYSFDISSYIHAVIYGVEQNNGFVISTPINGNKVLANRTIVPSGKIILKIYYTKLN